MMTHTNTLNHLPLEHSTNRLQGGTKTDH